MTNKDITPQKIVWWMLLTVTAVLISIAGGWVGSVNAFMTASMERQARLENMVQHFNAQYAVIIRELQKK